MQPQRLLYLHILFWLLFLLALFGRGPLTRPTWWAEACGPAAAAAARIGPAVTPPNSDEPPEAADPWAFGPGGSRLDAGYAPGQQRPGLLP